MRFAIVSDSLTSFTGFAKQTRLLAFELFRRGHEVIVIARADNGLAKEEGWRNDDLKKGPVEWPTEFFFDARKVESLVRDARPDVVLLFRNARYLQKFENSSLFSTIKTLLWYADENEAPFLSDFSESEGFPDHCVLPISYAVAACVKPEKVAGVLYHGLDFDNLPQKQNKSELRMKWSDLLGTQLLQDELLIICAERNDVRKNWDGTYALFKMIREKLLDKHVRLVQLTSQTEREPFFDLDLCSRFYGIETSVVDVSDKYGALTDAELCEILMLCDLRISCAGSEGFGLISLEAAALKLPQVTVKLRALTEYLGEDNPSLVEPYRLAVYPKDIFYYSSKVYAIPDIDRMSDRVINMLTNTELRNTVVEQSFNRVRSLCHWPVLVDKFLEIVDMTPNP